MAGEGRLAPGLDWASGVGLVGEDFVDFAGFAPDLEAQGEGVTEKPLDLHFRIISRSILMCELN